MKYLFSISEICLLAACSLENKWPLIDRDENPTSPIFFSFPQSSTSSMLPCIELDYPTSLEEYRSARDVFMKYNDSRCFHFDLPILSDKLSVEKIIAMIPKEEWFEYAPAGGGYSIRYPLFHPGISFHDHLSEQSLDPCLPENEHSSLPGSIPYMGVSKPTMMNRDNVRAAWGKVDFLDPARTTDFPNGIQ